MWEIHNIKLTIINFFLYKRMKVKGKGETFPDLHAGNGNKDSTLSQSILSLHFCGKNVHSVVQQCSVTFSSCETQTLYPSKTIFLFPLPSALDGLFV
jgi:hypothetical protein